MHMISLVRLKKIKTKFNHCITTLLLKSYVNKRKQAAHWLWSPAGNTAI